MHECTMLVLNSRDFNLSFIKFEGSVLRLQ